MPTAKNKPKRDPRPKPATTPSAITNGDVLTLAETAEYLRVSENEVACLIREQGLPGRKLGGEWRFLKIALQDWLRAPPSKKEGLRLQIGAFADDPNLGEMLEQIHKRRGRQDAEGD